MKKLMITVLVASAMIVAGWGGMASAQEKQDPAADAAIDRVQKQIEDLRKELPPGITIRLEGKRRVVAEGVMMEGVSDQMTARCRMTMGAELSPRDPAVLLGMKDQLELTDNQVEQLKTLAQETRQTAAAILNDAQRQKVQELPQQPQSMMQMHQQMMERMQEHGEGHMQDMGDMDMCAMMMRMMRGGMGRGAMMRPATQPEDQPEDQPDLNAKAQGQVDRLVTAYLKIQQRLAQDEMEGVTAQLADMHQTAHALAETDATEVRKSAEAVATVAHGAEPANLDEARKVLKPLSAGMIELVQIAPPSDQAASALHVANCPMANANWLQTTEQVTNPYMGQRMPRCGSIDQAIKQAADSEHEHE